MKNTAVEIVLNNQCHGYRDYDVRHPVISRACVPFNILNGDVFNIYLSNGSKCGCIWKKDLETSLQSFSVDKEESQLELFN